MARSCKEIAETLVDCMMKSKCVRDGGEVRECIKNPVSDEGVKSAGDCQEFRTAYFLCKRGSLDMRNRIKGQKSY